MGTAEGEVVTDQLKAQVELLVLVAEDVLVNPGLEAECCDRNSCYAPTLFEFARIFPALVQSWKERGEAIEHVINDSPGTPQSVKSYLRKALQAATSERDAE